MVTKTPRPIGQQARWLEILQEFDYKVIHRPGRIHNNADALSRRSHCNQCKREDLGCEGLRFSKEKKEVEEINVNSNHNQIVSEIKIDDQRKINEEKFSKVKAGYVCAVVLNEPIPGSTWDPLELSKATSKDKDLKIVKEFLRRLEVEEIPVNEISSSSRVVKLYWTQKDRLELKDGVLYRRWEGENNSINHWQIIPPADYQNKVIALFHDGMTNCHTGIKKTQEKIQKFAYWVGWKKDVEKYILSCEECARYFRGKPSYRAPLQIALVGEPFERISLDITGPHPRSRLGNVWILTIIDLFTKWAMAFPIRNHEATTVAKILIDKVFTSFGTPLQILTDRGKEFESRLLGELCKQFEIEKLRTVSYKPSTNGGIERFHRTLNQLIGKVVRDDQRNWDECLPFVMAAYRATKHDSTGFTPNYLMFGREVNSPISLVLGKTQDEPNENSYLSLVSDRVDKFEKAYELTRMYLKKSAERNRNNYNLRTKTVSYDIGDWVWYYYPRRYTKRSPKWQKMYTGPFERIQKLGEVNVKLQKSPRSKPFVTHVDKIKPFYGEIPNSQEKIGGSKGEKKKSTTKTIGICDESNESRENSDVEEQHLRKLPKRTIRKPLRYVNRIVSKSNVCNSDASSSESSGDVDFRSGNPICIGTQGGRLGRPPKTAQTVSNSGTPFICPLTDKCGAWFTKRDNLRCHCAAQHSMYLTVEGGCRQQTQKRLSIILRDQELRGGEKEKDDTIELGDHMCFNESSNDDSKSKRINFIQPTTMLPRFAQKGIGSKKIDMINETINNQKGECNASISSFSSSQSSLGEGVVDVELRIEENETGEQNSSRCDRKASKDQQVPLSNLVFKDILPYGMSDAEGERLLELGNREMSRDIERIELVKLKQKDPEVEMKEVEEVQVESEEREEIEYLRKAALISMDKGDKDGKLNRVSDKYPRKKIKKNEDQAATWSELMDVINWQDLREVQVETGEASHAITSLHSQTNSMLGVDKFPELTHSYIESILGSYEERDRENEDTDFENMLQSCSDIENSYFEPNTKLTKVIESKGKVSERRKVMDSGDRKESDIDNLPNDDVHEEVETERKDEKEVKEKQTKVLTYDPKDKLTFDQKGERQLSEGVCTNSINNKKTSISKCSKLKISECLNRLTEAEENSILSKKKAIPEVVLGKPNEKELDDQTIKSVVNSDEKEEEESLTDMEEECRQNRSFGSQNSSVSEKEWYVLKPNEILTYINLHGGPFRGMDLGRPVRISVANKEGLPTLSLAFTKYGATRKEYLRMSDYQYGDRNKEEMPSRDRIVGILHNLDAPWEVSKLKTLLGDMYPNVSKSKWMRGVEDAVKYYTQFTSCLKRKIEDFASGNRVGLSEAACQLVFQQIAASKTH